MYKPARAAPSRQSNQGLRAAGSAVRKTAGAGRHLLAPVLILLYVLFYANLPDQINGVPFKPFVTAGTIDRIVKVLAIAVSLGVIASRWSLVRVFVKSINPGLLACMILIPMSAAWSIDSNATVLRFITLLGLFLLCIAIAVAGWDPRRFQNTAFPPVMFILIGSLLFGILQPVAVKEIGDDISLSNSWRGITFQKNQFGMTASVGVILCLHRLIAMGRSSAWNWAALGIALICLVLSRSSTSLFASLLAGFFMVLALRVPVVKFRFTTAVVVGIFTVIIVYAAAIQNLIPGVNTLLKPVMQLTGKDMTFSARSVIWEIIKQHSAASPWLGSGYGAYWTGEVPTSASYVFVYIMSFYPTEAHNGYLEILNDLGRVGLVCLFAFLAWYVRHALQLMPFDRNQAVLHLALLYQQMVANLSESEWFSRTTVSTLLILGSLCLSRTLFEVQQQSRLTTRPIRRR